VTQSTISLRGVAVNNLQKVDLDLPHRQLIAFCGVSGSGKTSLALDTLYAEGQRRYIESFSTYTRQFLEQLDPSVDCRHSQECKPLQSGHGG
jgi:excinuclease ABC subunit A